MFFQRNFPEPENKGVSNLSSAPQYLTSFRPPDLKQRESSSNVIHVGIELCSQFPRKVSIEKSLCITHGLEGSLHHTCMDIEVAAPAPCAASSRRLRRPRTWPLRPLSSCSLASHGARGHSHSGTTAASPGARYSTATHGVGPTYEDATTRRRTTRPCRRLASSLGCGGGGNISEETRDDGLGLGTSTVRLREGCGGAGATGH